MMSNPTENDPRSHELTCVVVEDQGLFMEMLGGMLNMRGGLRVVGSALDVAGAKSACAEHRPDLLVLDLDLPDGSGLLVAEHLLGINPAARIIIVSGHASDFVCPAWLDKNLQAIISKNDTFAALRAELDEILVSRHIKPQPEDREAFAEKPLTAREAEIFALIGEGLLSKEIAERLQISQHTVQAHRKRMAAKLGTSGPELMQRAIAQRRTFFADRNGR